MLPHWLGRVLQGGLPARGVGFLGCLGTSHGLREARLFHHHAQWLGIDCRLHDLRHCHATQLLGQGIHPKTVSERLGHTKVGFALDTYAHAVQGMAEEAAMKIGAALQTALATADKNSR